MSIRIIKRMRIVGILAAALLFAAGLWGFWPAVADPKAVTGEGEILPYLEQVIAWQREAAAIEPTLGSARESLLKTSLSQSAAHVVKFSFAFARIQAQIIDQEKPGSNAVDQDGDQAHLQAAAAKVAQHLADLQGQSAALTEQLKTTPRKDRPPLAAKIDEVNGQIKLATAQQDLIGNLLGVFNGMISGTSSGMIGKVNSLSDSVAQADKPGDPAKPDAATPAAKPTPAPPSGLIADIGDLFKLWRQVNDLHNLESSVADLRKTNKGFLDTLREGLKAAIKQGSDIGAPPPAPAPGTTVQPAPVPQTIDALLANFKQLSDAIVPVTQTNIWLDASAHTIDEWQATIRSEVETLLRHLAVRLGVLGGLILIPVVISELAKRATNRYVKDEKRVKQLRAVRRSLLTLAIAIIVLLNVVTEVGSFATFAGLIVGGLAVAFQNVLLSLVAFFFFYGRYGVRAGDRVSVSGVIGDVVHVGAVRFYVRELTGEDKLEPTGRVAAFPNSILFQTSAFFKYA